MSKDADTPIVVQGSSKIIEYAIRGNGSMPAKDFIDELTVKERAQLAALFQHMADTGRISDFRKFKKLEGKLFEFKRFQLRIGCFSIGDRWILTHGFIKKSDAWPRKEIERAEQIMKEHLSREGKKDEYNK